MRWDTGGNDSRQLLLCGADVTPAPCLPACACLCSTSKGACRRCLDGAQHAAAAASAARVVCAQPRPCCRTETEQLAADMAVL